MADQATTQSMIQNLLGAQTQGQSISGENANNGNPNTIYNQPSIPGEPAIGGPAPNQWVASPGTILAPGQPVDPYAAVRPTNLQAGSNSLVNDILNRMRSGNFGITPNPSGPGTGTTGPGTGNPNPTPNQPGYTPPGGGLRPNQIGPISGPIANNPHDWRGNYNNAMPGTGPRPGSGYNSLPWASNSGPMLLLNQDPSTRSNTIGNAIRNVASQGTDSLRSWLGNLATQAREAITNGIGNTGAWQQLLDVLSEPFMPGDWFNSQTGEWNNPAQAMGIANLLSEAVGDSSAGQGADFSWANPSDAAIGPVLSNIFANVQNREGMNRLFGDTQRQLLDYYNSAPQMSPQEFQDLMTRMNRTAGWNSMWDEGRAGDIGQELGRRAEAWDAQMRNRWTRMR